MTAFVPDFRHDVFVSYAHVDDELLPGEKEPWVTDFIKKLGNGLAMKLGRRDNFELWSDHQLGGNTPLTATILDALSKTATIVVVLSPGYVASEWCQREKETFLRLVKDRASSAEGSKVFIVELDPLGFEDVERPAEFAELIGYKFWIQDSYEKPARRVHVGGRAEDEQAYAASFNDLLHDLVGKLKAMAKAPRGVAASQPVISIAPNGRRSVFVAEPTFDLRAEGDDLRRFLDQSGIPVLPSSMYPRSPERFQAALDADLERCDLFVQLLGDQPVMWGAPDLPKGYVGLQYERAVALGKQIVQWRDGMNRQVGDIEDPVYREFLEMLERQSTLSIGTFDEFKRLIPREHNRPAPVERPPRDQTVVFVNADRSDDALAMELERMVLEHNVVCVRCPRSGDPEDVQRELTDSLVECQGLIVVFGAITPPWVARQLRQFRKVRGDRPLGEALAIYVGPPNESPGDPDKLEQIHYKLPGMRVFDGRSGIARNELESFLSGVTQDVAQ